MSPLSCALRPWVGEVPISYLSPCQLARVCMGSHSSQTTEAAAPKPLRDACKSGKSLLGRWNQVKSRVQDQPLQSDLFGDPCLPISEEGRGWQRMERAWSLSSMKLLTGVGSSPRSLETGGLEGVSNLQHRCAVKEQGEEEQDCDKSG